MCVIRHKLCLKNLYKKRKKAEKIEQQKIYFVHFAARISFEYAQEKIEKFFLRNFYNKAQEFFSNKLIIELMKIFFCLIRLS